MKIWIPISIILISVISLCIWDTYQTNSIFTKLEKDTSAIYSKVLTTDISDEKLSGDIFELNEFWTKKMDILCISISRKDLQPISDYLQYLYSASINKNQEDAVTYSRLLYYNAQGLKECTGITFINFL